MDGMIGLVAYLGPETMLPMTSVIAGVVGVVLMVGKQSFRLALGMLRIGGRKTRSKVAGRRVTGNGPHVRVPADGEAASDAATVASSTGAASPPASD